MSFLRLSVPPKPPTEKVEVQVVVTAKPQVRVTRVRTLALAAV
jgi:hypothetical protein